MTTRLNRSRVRALDLTELKTVDDSRFSISDQKLFRNRKRSVELYAQGVRHKVIFSETGRNRLQVSRDVHRVFSERADGGWNGWAGLIPYKRINPDDPSTRKNSMRRKEVLFARGAFTKLLKANPTLKIGLDNLIRNKTPDGNSRESATITPREIHTEFLRFCLQQGLTDKDYPLVTDDQGRRALLNYRNKQLIESPAQVLKALYGSDVGRDLRKSTGHDHAIPNPTRLFEHVQLDGWEVPLVATLEIPGPHPLRPIFVAMSAITLVLAVEIGSTCILGYSTRFGKNYGTLNVLRAIRKAILPWTRMELDPRLGISYAEGGGLPSGLSDDLQWIHWRDLHFDNCKAHLSPFLIQQIPASTPIASPRAAPNTHPVAEAINGQLTRFLRNTACSTERGFTNAASAAESLGLTEQLVDQIIDVTIANFNAMPPAGTNISRIELLRKFVADPRALVARVPRALRKQFELYDYEAVVTVRGIKRATKAGPALRRPFVHWHHGDYTSTKLSNRFDLIGKEVLIRGDSGDLRNVECWEMDGSPLGGLDVLGPWKGSKHGFETRSAADKLRRKGHSLNPANPAIAVVKALQNLAAANKSAAAELAQVLRETEIPLFGNDREVDPKMAPPVSVFHDPFPELGAVLG